jgi:hypothetical protein
MAKVVEVCKEKNPNKYVNAGDFIFSEFSGWGIVQYDSNERLTVHYFLNCHGWDYVDTISIKKVVRGSDMTVTLEY